MFWSIYCTKYYNAFRISWLPDRPRRGQRVTYATWVEAGHAFFFYYYFVSPRNTDLKPAPYTRTTLGNRRYICYIPLGIVLLQRPNSIITTTTTIAA